MPLVTLCVTLWTQSVLGCIPTQSVGTIRLDFQKSAIRKLRKVTVNKRKPGLMIATHTGPGYPLKALSCVPYGALLCCQPSEPDSSNC